MTSLSRFTMCLVALCLPAALTAQLVPGSTVGSTLPAAPDRVPGVETSQPVQWADFDRDGFNDALVVTTDGSLSLMRSLPEGGFADATEQSGLMGVHAALLTVFQDYDHDGWADVFVGSSDGRLTLMRNLGGSFLDVTAGSGLASEGSVLSAHWLDQDADGLLDLHLVTDRRNTLFRGLGGWAFAPIPLPITTAGSPGTTGGAGHADTGTTAGDVGTLAGPATVSSPAQSPASGATLGTGGTITSDIRSGGIGDDTRQGGSPPLLNCASSISDASSAGCIQASSVPTLGMLYPLSSDLFVAANGNVGMGTTNPSRPLQVVASSHGISQKHPTLNVDLTTYVSAIGGWIGTYASNPLHFYTGNSVPQMTLETSGNFGIGTTTPATLLDVNGWATVRGELEVEGDTTVLRLGVGTAAPTGSTGLAVGGKATIAQSLTAGSLITNGNAYLAWDTVLDGKVGIGTLTPATKLDVNGAITIRGGADIVESFESSCGVLEPGTVVVIDPANPGSLMCSSTAYDTKVAGVVSGAGGVNPGLLLGQADMFTGDTKVAMTGRVYVKCSTENGPIMAGDRLTTASREGHAMKVSEEQQSSGCVIGKAMSSLESGSGLVLVLVNLQ